MCEGRKNCSKKCSNEVEIVFIKRRRWNHAVELRGYGKPRFVHGF